MSTCPSWEEKKLDLWPGELGRMLFDWSDQSTASYWSDDCGGRGDDDQLFIICQIRGKGALHCHLPLGQVWELWVLLINDVWSSIALAVGKLNEHNTSCEEAELIFCRRKAAPLKHLPLVQRGSAKVVIDPLLIENRGLASAAGVKPPYLCALVWIALITNWGRVPADVKPCDAGECNWGLVPTDVRPWSIIFGTFLLKTLFDTLICQHFFVITPGCLQIPFMICPVLLLWFSFHGK